MTAHRILLFALCVTIAPARGQEPALANSPPGRANNMVIPMPSLSAQDSLISNLSMISTNHPFFQTAAAFSRFGNISLNPFDQRIFQEQFEQYLNEPEHASEADLTYQKMLRAILNNLSPTKVSPDSVSAAFGLLPRASSYDIDEHLCDDIANAVYMVWVARRDQQRLDRARKDIEEEWKRLEWNRTMATRDMLRKDMDQEDPLAVTARLAPFERRQAELTAMSAESKVKRELSQLQTKVEFQVLMVQLFFQRRFEHVQIATGFYRALFTDGDSTLQLQEGSRSKEFFSKGTGMPPTVATLDSLSNEIMGEVEEGVEAYLFLLENDEVANAARRLAQAYAFGEHLPEIRTLPREKKRRIFEFSQKVGRLQSAMRARDFELAGTHADEAATLAPDYDMAEPMALIETAKTASNMHLAKARNAALSGDIEEMESALKRATTIWPLNPNLKEVAETMFSVTDQHQQALLDLDRLLGEKNYRRIFEDQFRFIAAVAIDTNRQAQLAEALQQIQKIEGTIARCEAIARRGDSIGAWEETERIYREFPEDRMINKLRSDLTIDAADFVKTIRKAWDLEERNQPGSSLAWFLKARGMHPSSSYAREGIKRIVSKILPDTDS